MFLSLTPVLTTAATLFSGGPRAPRPQALLSAFLRFSDDRGNVYNILWALVFGFATLNILSLLGRRFEPERSRLTFGETVAIMVVLVSVVLLGLEFMHLFKIFPIKLHTQ
ncbi:MAG TPA: hypothetical protein VLV49_06560 [Terriglobales bacterium]|nr:hypothetical protein [Terriglobales bacterium]